MTWTVNKTFITFGGNNTLAATGRLVWTHRVCAVPAPCSRHGKKPHGFKTKHRMANKLLRINGLALSKVMCHVDWDAMWECSCSCQLEMTCCKRWDYGDKEPCSLDPCFVNPALSATVLEHPLPPGCLPGACTIRSFLQMPELSPEPISTNY